MRQYINKAFMKQALIIVLLALSCFVAEAQNKAQVEPDTAISFSHSVIGRAQGDSIELRWAPSTYAHWMHASEEGWIIERIELSKSFYNLDDQTPLTGDTVFKRITAQPVMPWPETEWKQRVSPTDSNTALALQLLYTPSPVPAGSDPFAVMKKIADDQERRHGFALMAADFSAVTASAIGLRYVDRNIKAGKAYLYRLMVPKPDDPDLKFDTIQVLVDTRSPWKQATVQKVFTEAGDKEVSVNWPALNDPFFTAYDIERSEDNKKWAKLNNRPYVVSKSFSEDKANFYVDTTLEKNYKTYYYRVRGYSAFGDMGLYSETVTVNGKDLKAPANAFDIKVIDLGMNKVKITWDAFASEPDFKGFYVGKSTEAAGEFPKLSKLLPKAQKEFIDDNVSTLVSNYYAVFVVDTAGNESISYVAYADLMDSIAPVKPAGLRAEIDTFGNVFLDWEEGKEMDIIGYRVYWANDKNAEFSQLTGELVPGINYVDSVEIKTLSPMVYYRIAAVDHRYNHSEMSDILEVKRPDLIAPSAPVISSYEATNSSVFLQWINSSSTDVVKQLVKRRTAGSWETVYELKDNVSKTYTDSKIETGNEYAYTIVAEDAAGNQSEMAFPLELTIVDKGGRQAVSGLKLDYLKEQKTVKLSWSNPQGSISKILVYRNSAGEGLLYYRSLSAAAAEFTDNSVEEAEQLSYAIKVIYTDGMESLMSAEVKK